MFLPNARSDGSDKLKRASATPRFCFIPPPCLAHRCQLDTLWSKPRRCPFEEKYLLRVSISPLILGDKLWWRFCVCFLSVKGFFVFSNFKAGASISFGVPCSMLCEILCICLKPRPSSYLSLLPTWHRVGEVDKSAVSFLLWWHVLSSRVDFEKQQRLLLTVQNLTHIKTFILKFGGRITVTPCFPASFCLSAVFDRCVINRWTKDVVVFFVCLFGVFFFK